MPLKAEIMQHLDEISPESHATGACNTIVPVKDAAGKTKLVGTNTDFLGVRNSLLAALATQQPSVSVGTTAKYAPGQASGMVIGGGATTRSAVHALYSLGMNPVFLANRDAAEVEDTIKHFDSRSDPEDLNRLRLVHLTSVDDVEGHLGPGAAKPSPSVAMIVGAIPGKSLDSSDISNSPKVPRGAHGLHHRNPCVHPAVPGECSQQRVVPPRTFPAYLPRHGVQAAHDAAAEDRGGARVAGCGRYPGDD